MPRLLVKCAGPLVGMTSALARGNSNPSHEREIMKVLNAALFTILAVSAAACAHDRNQDVKSSESNLTSAQREAQLEQQRLDWKQAQESAKADNQNMSTSDRAELQTKQLDERAEMNADGTKKIADADKDVTAAHADMTKERATFEADAKEKLNKLSAKALESKNKSGKLNASKQAKFNSTWSTYSNRKAAALQNIQALGTVSNDEWKAAKERVNKSLEDLDSSVSKLDDDL